jgi:hypothetical protein
MVFDEVINGIYESETAAVSAKNRLKVLRNKHSISYTDEAGILDAIIDRAQEQTLTHDEAKFYFGLLQEGKLMEYRKETYRQKSEQPLRELLVLLQQKLESADSSEASSEELLAILNNYYDFVGLEYDEQYFRLSTLILSMKEERIPAQEIAIVLNSMEHQLSLNNNQQLIQSSSHQQSQENDPPQTQTGNPPEAGINASEPPERPSTSGTGGQPPSNSGAGTRK